MYLLAIDPGFTKANPTGLAIFSEGLLIHWRDIFPLGKSPHDRRESILDALDYYAYSFSAGEIACEQINAWKGKRNLEGLVVLARDIKGLADRLKIPCHFYTPGQWHGQWPSHVWKEAIRQEAGLPEGVSRHILSAVGIGKYHLAAQKEG